MSKIKGLIAKETATWVQFPEMEEFEIHLRYLTREDLMKIRNKALTYKFNKRTRQREEEVDNEKFLEAYAEKAIAGWKGLKVKHLPVLLPVDISTMDAAEEVEYSMEDAIELLKNFSKINLLINVKNNTSGNDLNKKCKAILMSGAATKLNRPNEVE